MLDMQYYASRFSDDLLDSPGAEEDSSTSFGEHDGFTARGGLEA